MWLCAMVLCGCCFTFAAIIFLFYYTNVIFTLAFLFLFVFYRAEWELLRWNCSIRFLTRASCRARSFLCAPYRLFHFFPLWNKSASNSKDAFGRRSKTDRSVHYNFHWISVFCASVFYYCHFGCTYDDLCTLTANCSLSNWIIWCFFVVLDAHVPIWLFVWFILADLTVPLRAFALLFISLPFVICTWASQLYVEHFITYTTSWFIGFGRISVATLWHLSGLLDVINIAYRFDSITIFATEIAGLDLDAWIWWGKVDSASNLTNHCNGEFESNGDHNTVDFVHSN